MTETRDGELTADRPWPGMRPYREQDAGYFFGRDAEIADLRNRTERAMLTLLYARGGLGKTSLVRAGLSPTLAERAYLPVYLRPRLLLEGGLDPIAEVLRHLDDAATRAGVEATGRVDAPTLWELFHRESFDLWDATNRLVTPVLIFDQFEEVFQIIDEQPAAAPRAKALLDNIADLVENRLPARLVAMELPADDDHRFDTALPACRVILSFREDYLPQVRRLRVVLPSVIENHVRLEPLSGQQALQVVQNAGRAHVDADAARVLVRAVGRPAGLLQRLLVPAQPAQAEAPGSVDNLEVEPSILSVVCFHLNAERQKQSRGTIDVGLVQRKQPRDIFEDYYRQAMAGVGATARRFVETRLVTPGGERLLYPMSAVVSAGAALSAAVSTLVEQGILRKEWLGGEQRLEISHDLLLQPVRRDLEAAATAAANRKRQWAFAGLLSVIVLVALAMAVTQRNRINREFKRRIIQSEALLVAYVSSAPGTGAEAYANEISGLANQIDPAASAPEKAAAIEKLFDRSMALGPLLPPIPRRRLPEVSIEYAQVKIDQAGLGPGDLGTLLPKLSARVDRACAEGFNFPGDSLVDWFAAHGGIPPACQ